MLSMLPETPVHWLSDDGNGLSDPDFHLNVMSEGEHAEFVETLARELLYANADDPGAPDIFG
jgi:hypothetical protein